ncbi:MAG: hypothetical protein ONB43_17750 [candidate division KSB1 bacterium]|nr:hypothetical protein [candidate division KSB1 bacterium]
MDYAQEVWAFLFETAGEEGVKKMATIGNIFAKLSTIGKKWLLLESFGEAA